MTRTDTSQRTEFFIGNEGGIRFPQPPGSSPGVHIYFLTGCKQSTGLHWHETHTELLRVKQGAACLELDGVMRVITQWDGEVVVKRGVRHQYWRADRDINAMKGKWNSQESSLIGLRLEEEVEKEELQKDLIVIESTDPADRDKEVYFRQILSLLEEKEGNVLSETLWMLWGFFVVFNGHDNFPVVQKVTRRFGDGVGKGLEWGITHSVLNVATVLGRLVGLKSTYDEYTPIELRDKDDKGKSRDQ